MWMKRELKRCRSFVAFLMVSVLVAVVLVPVCSAVGAAEAGDVISQAERDLGSAYVAVAEAERAGGDVSILVGRLGGAGGFLAKAYAAFRAGDYENASLLALECSRVVDGVIGDAAGLKVEAEEARSNKMFWTAAWPIAGLGLLFNLGLVGWRFLKRRHLRRVLDKKPEVGEDL